MLQIWGHPVKHTSIPMFPQRIETFFMLLWHFLPWPSPPFCKGITRLGIRWVKFRGCRTENQNCSSVWSQRGQQFGWGRPLFCNRSAVQHRFQIITCFGFYWCPIHWWYFNSMIRVRLSNYNAFILADQPTRLTITRKIGGWDPEAIFKCELRTLLNDN